MRKIWLPVVLLCLWGTLGTEARSTPKEVKLDTRSKRQLSRFCQDIVSSYIEDFSPGKVPNKVLVNFGIYYLGLRRPKLFEDVDPHDFPIRVAAKHVEAAVTQFFGRKVKHQSVGDWKYKHGFYYGDAELFEQSEAEEIKRVRLLDEGNGLYVAYVDYVDSMATATSDSGEEVIVKTRMTLRKVSSRGQSRYILVGYKSLSPKP